MLVISVSKNGKTYYKTATDNWWNVYLNRARFENLPVKWISDTEYQIIIKGKIYTVTSDKHIDRRF